MIEVIYLISRARPSGPINQALNILMGMKQNGRVHAVLVTLAPEEENNSWLQRFYDNGIEVVQFMQPLKNTWRCINMLQEYVELHHVQVIHSAGYRADFVSLMTKCNAKKVSTQRCLPNEVAEKLPKVCRPLLEKAHLKMIKKMDAVVACSQSLQKVFKGEYGINASAVQNGVNTTFFLPVDDNVKKELRVDNRIPQDCIAYLVLGRLSERKNIGLIIEAFKKISNPNIRLIIVGDGPLRKELEDRACDDKRITFTGNTKAPLKYLQLSDILISSALAEGLPNTVLEALSCGLPCILSDIDPHLEIVKDTNLECIFNRLSEDELSSLIQKSSSWNIKERSKFARELADKKFGIIRLANDYELVYKQIL